MWNILAGIAGSAIGKVVGKLVDYIPTKEEGRRNEIDKLKKERRFLLTKKDSPAVRARLEYIMARQRVLEDAAINK